MGHLQCTARRKFGASVPETSPEFIRRLIAGWDRCLDDRYGAAALLAKAQLYGFTRSVRIGDAPRRWQFRKVPACDSIETSRSPILLLSGCAPGNKRRRFQRFIEVCEIGEHFAIAVSAVSAQPRQNLVPFELLGVQEDRGKLRGVVARLEVRVQLIQEPMELLWRKRIPAR